MIVSFEEALTKEFLQKKYIEQNLSQKQIAILVGCTATTIRRYLLKFAIPLRTASQLNSGTNNPFYGKKHSKKVLAIISKVHKGKTFQHTKEFKENHSKLFSKEKNPNWKGGIKDFSATVRNLEQYKIWRQTCFERDEFTCIFCGDDKGHNLNVDHIKPLGVILKEYNIRTCEQARLCDALWDIKNGRTLCEICHRQTDTWGYKTSKILRRVKYEHY